MDIRTGFGYDVHQLVEGRDLWLGGVQIDAEKGALGHSDADVLLHVIIDALLGATGLGDIGQHFPDTDPAYKGADSKDLLKATLEIIGAKGFQVHNIDSTVCLEAPKLRPHIDEMRAKIAELVGVDVDKVSVKATTSESMGFIGRKDGIAAYAVVLVQRPA